MKLPILSLLIFLYFVISWFTPWQYIEIPYSISASYIFDIIVILLFAYKCKFRLRLGLRPNLLKESLISFLFACLSLGFIYWKNITTPLLHIPNLFLHLVIIAPLLEELVFRFIFQNLLSQSLKSKKIILIISALIFSISHSYALSFMPEIYKPFVYLQLLYTLPLGYLCARSFYNNNILGAYIIHLVFNSSFYIAIKYLF
jgi:membrane protease YdiL (CAAX protease family)